jgi:hypothetical protein
MGQAKETERRESSELPQERPSERSLLTSTIMEPALENTSRTVNKIRDELGLESHRYLLATDNGDGSRETEEIVENVRVALLRAMARTQETNGRIEVFEKDSRRLLCWAERGMLFGADGLGEISADMIVQGERRKYAPA